MAKIRVIINGNEVLAPLGATVLEAASQAGITSRRSATIAR